MEHDGKLNAIANAIRGFKSHQAEPAKDEDEEFEIPPLAPVALEGYASTTKKHLLTSSLCEEIRSMLPARLQLHDSWHLVYALGQHGASLSTLYHNVKPSNERRRPGYVLVIEDDHSAVFGAYVNEYFHPSDKRFYGNGECFLWRVSKPSKTVTNVNNTDTVGPSSNSDGFEAYPYTGENDFCIFCTTRFLSMGGGDGHYGLWLDDGLENGLSGRTLTFGNEPLSPGGTKFKIIGLEVWEVGGR